MELEAMVAYGIKVARCIWRDPEAESIANEESWRAWQTYDPSLNVPPERWVAFLVKQGIWNYWRKMRRRREKYMEEKFWESATRFYDKLEFELSQADCQLLHEYYIDKWCLDIVARRHGVGLAKMRGMMREAESRFLFSMEEVTVNK